MIEEQLAKAINTLYFESSHYGIRVVSGYYTCGSPNKAEAGFIPKRGGNLLESAVLGMPFSQVVDKSSWSRFLNISNWTKTKKLFD